MSRVYNLQGRLENMERQLNALIEFANDSKNVKEELALLTVAYAELEVELADTREQLDDMHTQLDALTATDE